MDSELKEVSISLDSVQDYEFRVKFDGLQPQDLIIDEPEPVGHDRGPARQNSLPPPSEDASVSVWARRDAASALKIHYSAALNLHAI
jgi:hypothetical protein